MARDYFNSIYDVIWERKTKFYGFAKYEKFIVHEIIKRNPDKVFEVGIGNAWPIGMALKKKNIRVFGCDVSKKLVEAAHQNLNCNEGIYVGELKDIVLKEKFDTVYCVRTSWYITDFYQVLERMFSIVENDGYVIFDIMERESLYFGKQVMDQIKTIIKKYMGLKEENRRRLFFYSRFEIEKYLRKNKISYYCFNERLIEHSNDYANTPKRIYICKKGK